MDNFDVAALMQGAEAEQAMIEADLQALADSLNSQPSEEVRASVQSRVVILTDRRHALGALIARAHTLQKLGPYPTLNAFPGMPDEAPSAEELEDKLLLTGRL